LAPSEQQVREQLAKILGDRALGPNERLRLFLTHVVDRTLKGRQSEIKEVTIATEVFGDPGTYDPRVDSRVRTDAKRLREKLAQYYVSDGRLDRVQIELPKGSYVPVFQLREIPAAAQNPAQNEQRPPSHHSPRWILAAIALLVASGFIGYRLRQAPRTVSHAVTLVILPFDSSELDESSRYLAAGLREDLARDLSRIHGLELHASPPADQVDRHKGVDYAAIGKKAKADYVFDASAGPGRDGKEVRAQLIDANDNSVAWVDHFALSDDDSAERNVAKGIAKALKLELPKAPVRPENARAHDLFLQGRVLAAIRIYGRTQEALALYRKALEIDPDYALAWMGIADAYALMTQNGQIPFADGVNEAEKAAARAIALDPDLADAHASLGLIRMTQWRWPEADRELKRAIDLNPSYDRAYARAGLLKYYLGDFAMGETLVRKAETLSPYSLAIPMLRAQGYIVTRRYQDALDLCESIRGLNPEHVTTYGQEAVALHFLGRHQQALEAEEKLFDFEVRVGGRQRKPDRALAPYLFATGHTNEARQLMDDAIAQRSVKFADAYILAEEWGMMGNRAETLRWLEQALIEHSPDLPSLRVDPMFDFVRGEARYQAVVRKVFPE
jgi:serine/threonine-protein kinase